MSSPQPPGPNPTLEMFMDFQEKAKLLVAQYFNEKVEKTDAAEITIDDVYIVWFSKTLKNWKALVSTTVPDGMYYEVTYNGELGETYLDAYKKWDNVCVPDMPKFHEAEGLETQDSVRKKLGFHDG